MPSTTARRPAALPLSAIALATVAGLSSLPAAVLAQTSADSTERITIVGSRRATPASSSIDSTVPVDVYSLGKAAESGGQFDLAQTLQYLSPSFNSTRQTGADGADLIDSAALRGLGSDQTLVLVNGKRRHTVALVNLFGARNRGSTGTDMNAIPLLAIDNVQVLRDGAAAQYGSDAIAGVINIQLKKRAGCEAVAGYGQYSAGDGKNGLLSAYCGIKLGGGTLGITGEWQDRGRSNRAEAGNPRIIGDTQVRNETVYLNGDLPLGGGTSLYGTAGLQNRRASSAAWARGGVGSGDIPSRNSAAMYPDGFVPFINGDIEDRTLIAGVRTTLGGWAFDLSAAIAPGSPLAAILQATVGCSWNRCVYCDMYREKAFRVRELAESLADVEAARNAGFDEQKIMTANRLPQALRMLTSGRVDLISSNKATLMDLIQAQQLDPAQFEVRWVLSSEQFCFAFSHPVDDALVVGVLERA